MLKDPIGPMEVHRPMQSLYAATMVDVAFDEPNLVANAGPVPMIALAEHAGLPELVVDHLAVVDAADSAGPTRTRR